LRLSLSKTLVFEISVPMSRFHRLYTGGSGVYESPRIEGLLLPVCVISETPLKKPENRRVHVKRGRRGPLNITLIQAVLAFSGALLAPIIGTIAALLSRSELQRKQQEAEYNIKRLDLIDKTITVGKSISNTLRVEIDVSLAQSEYARVLNSLSEPPPPSEQDLLPFEGH
jgi:hypothetical protein